LTYALEKRVRLPDVDLPSSPEGTGPAHAAQTLRKAWGMGRGPLPHLVALIESRGIVVSLISMTNESVKNVSAYSTDVLGRPLIIVTPERATSVYRYRFTCAHELGHLLMHSNPLPGDRQQEREADEFAAELLTPQVEIEPLLPRTMRIAALEKLTSEWGVSVESLIWRMGETRMVSDASVRRAHQRLKSAPELRRNEPISMYKGEVPSLLRDALALAERYGLTRRELAIELCWTVSHLDEMLGDEDRRPVLRLVP
jgi:Zn-dependent peptidase ImmA (M78 family)